MESVGYEMYTRLLEETVKELQGEEVAPKLEIQIDIKVSAYIPDEYIENTSQKIEVYQDIANIENEEQISEMCDELIDRYGEMPDEMFNLLEIARIKTYARKFKIQKITQIDDKIGFKFADAEFINGENISLLLDNFKRRIFISGDEAPFVTIKLEKTDEKEVLKEILKFLKML